MCVCTVLGQARRSVGLGQPSKPNWPQDTQSREVKKNLTKGNVLNEENFEEQLACARAACRSGTVAGTALLAAVAIEKRKKGGVTHWNLVIRIGGKQKFSLHQKQAVPRNINIDTGVAAGNRVVQKLQEEGLDSNVSIAEMFEESLRSLNVMEPEDLA